MADVFEVANYLIYLAQTSGDEPDYLTHLRLQKLMYYVQGWSLALRDAPMFEERIEAWSNGPVVPVLYQKLKDFRGRAFGFDGDELPEINLDETEQSFIGQVWEAYKEYSALSLRDRTHDEPPWKNARKGLGPGERSTNEITKSALKEFFTTLLKNE